MILQVLFIAALPMCLAQFSIQGPSDGHRRAQGLKYSAEKGIEYSDQNESQGAGDFSIQGATDGHSNFQIQGADDGRSDFQIQGATDGHSNFQIQGATDGGADAFHIQGATDGHSQSHIQGPYDPNNQGGPGKSLQYNDPSGFRVNWKSYDRRQPAAAQPQQQYVEPARPQPVAPRRQHAQHAQQPQPQAQAVSQPVYRPYDNAPAHLKQLLQFQHQLPYVNIIPEPYRYDNLQSAHGQQQHQDQGREQGGEPPYRPKARPSSRPRRQAQQHQSRQQPQSAAAQQYRRIPQPPADPQIRYNTNVPSNLQQILKYQSQIPYVNVIPEPFRFDTDAAVREQQAQVQAHLQNLAREAQSAPRQQHPSGGRPRQKRQAQHSQQHAAPQQPQYRRISQPQSEPLPSYSSNLPNSIRDLLKYQAQIPYSIYSNQVSYNVDKYTPQAAPPSAPAQPAHQQPQYQEAQLQQAQYQPTPHPQYNQVQAQQAQYQQAQVPQAQYQQSEIQQPQYSQPNSPLYRAPYQDQSSAYTHGHFTPEPQYAQLAGYAQPSGIRPVKENQY